MLRGISCGMLIKDFMDGGGEFMFSKGESSKIILISLIEILCIVNVYFPYPILFNFLLEKSSHAIFSFYAAHGILPDINSVKLSLTPFSTFGIILGCILLGLSYLRVMVKLPIFRKVVVISSCFGIGFTILIMLLFWFDFQVIFNPGRGIPVTIKFAHFFGRFMFN